MTKVTDLEANLEQFKIEQAAINSEAAKQLALLQATIEKNKVEADRQFAEIMNALNALPSRGYNNDRYGKKWENPLKECYVIHLLEINIVELRVRKIVINRIGEL
ncbi:hypothetical protein Tco_1186637 [Tanacetum coccineum]